MSKVMTFSRTYPSYHPRKGEPTYFPEKILTSIGNENFLSVNHGYEPKHHTIRAGHRWKVGDKFSPRVWSGVPYKSKQIIIAPDIEVKKVWEIRIDLLDQYECVYLVDKLGYPIIVEEATLAKNDGLTEQDFYDWFDTPRNRKEVFSGQIICWNENINY